MRSDLLLRSLPRRAALASALALLGVAAAAPARADGPIHSQASSTGAESRRGLLLLSFLVPLPLPLVLVAPPAASRPPEVPTQRADRQPPLPAAPAARVAGRTGR